MLPSQAPRFRRLLLAWFRASARDLPWRRTRDPYRIWLSEVMLQQTRAAAAEPYYHRFLARFPTLADLARAPESDVLALWAGLGYYSRARLLHRAARALAALDRFPTDFDSLRALPGIGHYTAAAVSSIAFSQPHAVLDGNVARLLARLTAEPASIASSSTRARLLDTASSLLDPKSPGPFNQAMMELGATICLPRNPRCPSCPVSSFCAAFHSGRQSEFPVKAPRKQFHDARRDLLLILHRRRVLFHQLPPTSPRLAGFWDLPDAGSLPNARRGPLLGVFHHTIVQTRYTCHVWKATLASPAPGFSWLPLEDMSQFPIATIAKKALKLAGI